MVTFLRCMRPENSFLVWILLAVRSSALIYNVVNILWNSQCEILYINHIKLWIGLLLNSCVKCISCQTIQPAGPQRKILIDTAVAFNQLRKNESSLLCMKASVCQKKKERKLSSDGRKAATIKKTNMVKTSCKMWVDRGNQTVCHHVKVKTDIL